MTAIQYDEVHRYSIQHIARLPVQDLLALQERSTTTFEKAKCAKATIDSALAMKYSESLDAVRAREGKEYGVIRLEDDGVPIEASRSKRVSWNQDKLADLADKIRANGDDPNEYIEISYKVPERKYGSWPSHLKDAFTPAREIKYGKQSITLGDAGGDE